MKKNMGNIDRLIRVIAGLSIISLALVGPQSPWAFFGIIPLLSGLAGWCPPYALMGWSTCRSCK